MTSIVDVDLCIAGPFNVINFMFISRIMICYVFYRCTTLKLKGICLRPLNKLCNQNEKMSTSACQRRKLDGRMEKRFCLINLIEIKIHKYEYCMLCRINDGNQKIQYKRSFEFWSRK